jgi:hypothetical protein
MVLMTTTTKLGNEIEFVLAVALAERLLKVLDFSHKDEQYVNRH